MVVTVERYRDFDRLLDKAIDVVDAPQPVRALYTPAGGTRVHSVTELKDGGVYVAAGVEHFHKLEYTQIMNERQRAAAHAKPPPVPVCHARCAHTYAPTRLNLQLNSDFISFGMTEHRLSSAHHVT